MAQSFPGITIERASTCNEVDKCQQQAHLIGGIAPTHRQPAYADNHRERSQEPGEDCLPEEQHILAPLQFLSTAPFFDNHIKTDVVQRLLHGL